MEFNGDIIITDPCYVDHDSKLLDQIYGSAGNGLNKFGFTSYLWSSTLYGDWSCRTYQIKSRHQGIVTASLAEEHVLPATLGRFCADSGLVGVFLLKEVLKFNPQFDYHLNRTHTTTWIKDFHGAVEMEEVTRPLNADDGYDGKEIQVRGYGTVPFVTRQVGC